LFFTSAFRSFLLQCNPDKRKKHVVEVEEPGLARALADCKAPMTRRYRVPDWVFDKHTDNSAKGSNNEAQRKALLTCAKQRGQLDIVAGFSQEEVRCCFLPLCFFHPIRSSSCVHFSADDDDANRVWCSRLRNRIASLKSPRIQ
jgi:hypothetical protein